MNITYSFLVTCLAGLSTLFGMCVIFFKNKDPNKVIVSSLSFAAGVMICVSITDLIPESFLLLTKSYNNIISFLFFGIFFCLGVILSMFIDDSMPDSEKYNNKLFKVGIISMIAIIMHNIPEGIATFLASNMDKELGISLAFAIAMHNIPEGISIAVPIYYSTKSKKISFIYTFISAISEPFGALIAFLFLRKLASDFFMAILFSIIAGIMIHISFYELLKEANTYNLKIRMYIFLFVGIIFMGINHFLF